MPNFGICNGIMKPKSIFLIASVYSDVQIVLVVLAVFDLSEIAGLEVGVENEMAWRRRKSFILRRFHGLMLYVADHVHYCRGTPILNMFNSTVLNEE